MVELVEVTSKPRRWILLIGILLVGFEALSVIVLVPLTTVSLSLGEVYQVLSLSRVLAIALVGSVISIAVVVPIAFHWDSHLRLWALVNMLALGVGAVATVSLFVDVVVSFGYLGFEDAYTEPVVVARDWAMSANLVGPALLVVALISMAVRFFVRTWQPVIPPVCD